ncbi:MAG: HEAT repeat domain-containing protein [Anaerolineae bacterium]|nr:MAG: HEAT repeat domain-containing protein [Anaerolineae bacterium]
MNEVKDDIDAIIREGVKNFVSTKVISEQLLRFDHQVLFDFLANYISDPTLGRLEWIAAIRTLCQIDRIKANNLLIEALQVNDADKRFRVVRLLGEYGTEQVVPTLVKMLKEEPEPGIRLMVAITLGAIGDKQAIPALQWSAEHDHDVDHEGVPVSYEAKQAIKRLEVL